MDNFLKISEWSTTPGSRFKKHGKWSAEEYSEKFLRPQLRHTIKTKKVLTVDLSGTMGFAASFLDELFGGLIYNHKFFKEDLDKYLKIVSEDRDWYLEEALKYIQEAYEASQEEGD